MTAWTRFGCFLTGWNSHILASCGEASFKQLKKYTAAILILIVLWAFTGYCFAERYVGAPWWGCTLSACIFVIIIIQIERQIILTVGANKWAGTLRFVIAIIMALLGSSIIDQIIFGDDIDKKMIEIRDRQVMEQLPMRLKVIDTRLSELQTDIDSLDNINANLNEEIVKKPTVTTISTSTTYIQEVQPDGTNKTMPQTTILKTPIENPRIKQVETNNENLKRLRKQSEDFTLKKMDAEQTLRNELGEKTGFLEELHAMLEIITTKTEALVFYLVVFFFLVSLELFVLMSKWGDKKCDYDLIIEYQLKMKKSKLESKIDPEHQ